MCGHRYRRIPQIRQQAEQARAKVAQSERVSVCGTDGVGGLFPALYLQIRVFSWQMRLYRFILCL